MEGVSISGSMRKYDCLLLSVPVLTFCRLTSLFGGITSTFLRSSSEASTKNTTSFGGISDGFVEVADTRVSRSSLKSTSDSELIVMTGSRMCRGLMSGLFVRFEALFLFTLG